MSQKQKKKKKALLIKAEVTGQEVSIETEINSLSTGIFLEIIGKVIGRTLNHINDNELAVALKEIEKNAKDEIKNGK